jgi:hypothetical protein
VVDHIPLIDPEEQRIVLRHLLGVAGDDHRVVELVYRHFVDHYKFPSLRFSPPIVTADTPDN